MQYTSYNPALMRLILLGILPFLSTNCLSRGDVQLNTNSADINSKMVLPSFTDLLDKGKNQTNSESLNQINPDDVTDQENIVVTFNEDPKFKKAEGGQISVDFVNEDIKQVLRYVSELYDLNIIIPTVLEGNVTIRLRNATWESLLESVLLPVNCTYTKHDNIIQICSLEAIEKEPLKTEVFLLKFAEAKQVSEEMKDFIDTSNGAKLTFNERSNILIITDRPKNLATYADIIEKLDRPETQVMIEAKFIEATSNASDKRGFEWPTGLTSYLGEAASSSSTSTNGSDSGSSSSSEDDVDGQIVRKINNSKALGPHTLTIKGLTGNFNFSQVDNLGKTLSNPTIITMNNVPAVMSVIHNYPVPNYSYNSDQGAYEISGFEEKPVGIELKVTPKVQAEYITLKIEPSLSSKSGDTEFSTDSSSIKYPQISQKKTDSTVTIKSGYTIAIGGLMTQEKANNVKKVPVLGDLPVLGKLFSSKEKTNNVTNLLIFLTATQISYDGKLLYPHVKEVSNISQKRMYDMGLTNNDLPGETLPGKQEEQYKQLQDLNAKIQDHANDKQLSKKIKKAESKIYLQKNGHKPNSIKNKNYLLPTTNKVEEKFVLTKPSEAIQEKRKPAVVEKSQSVVEKKSQSVTRTKKPKTHKHRSKKAKNPFSVFSKKKSKTAVQPELAPTNAVEKQVIANPIIELPMGTEKQMIENAPAGTVN